MGQNMKQTPEGQQKGWEIKYLQTTTTYLNPAN